MVELDDEPTPTPPEDDGELERQRDTDVKREISQKLIDALKQGLVSETVEWPDTGPHKGKSW